MCHQPVASGQWPYQDFGMMWSMSKESRFSRTDSSVFSLRIAVSRRWKIGHPAWSYSMARIYARPAMLTQPASEQSASPTGSESPQFSRRLNTLRGLSHEEDKQVLA